MKIKRNIKSILCLNLIVSLALTLFPGTIFAESTTDDIIADSSVLTNTQRNYKTIFSEDFTVKADGSKYSSGDTPDNVWAASSIGELNENTGVNVVEDPENPDELVLLHSNCFDAPQSEDDYNVSRVISNEPGGEQILTFRMRFASPSFKNTLYFQNRSGETMFTICISVNRTYGTGWLVADKEFSGILSGKPIYTNKWLNIKLVMNDIARKADFFVDDEHYYTFNYIDTAGNAAFSRLVLANNNRGASVAQYYYDDFKLVENTDYKLAYAASLISIKNADAITNDFYLPLEFDYGVGISWKSSDSSYASIDPDSGLVTINKPQNGSGNKSVTLTADFEADGVIMTRDYEINIIEDISDEDKVKADETGLEFKDFCSEPANALSSDFTLPGVSKHGCKLTWESLDENVVSINGYNAEVKRSKSENLSTKIVAHISLGGYSAEKTFELRVLRDYGVNLAKNAGVHDVSSEVGKYSAQNALDANHGTFWMSASNDSAPYVIYRLAPDTTADIILLSMYSDNINTFAVDASTDGSAWNTLFEGNAGADSDIFSLNPGVKATYLRFRVTGKQQGACGLREFQVYSADGTGDIGEKIPDTVSGIGPDFEDPMHMTDEEFFGLWDAEAANWDEKYPGKIDYSTSDKLSLMEHFVKEGDYESAKSEWLYYLRSRAGQLNGGTTNDSEKADLWCDNIFTLNTFVNEFTVNNSESVISCDVSSAFSSSKKLSLILMSRYMDDDAAVFDSREGEASPRLIVRVDGKDYTFYPQKDAYIKACDNKANNFGTEPYLIVNEAYDSGNGEGKNTWSNDTSRAYLYFELNGLDANAKIQSATLELYGSTTGESARILVLSDTDASWSETGITWANAFPSDTLWQKNGYVEWNAFPDISAGMSSEAKYNIARSYYLNTLAGVYKSTRNEYYAYHGIRHMMQFVQQTGDTIGTYSALDAGIRGRQMTLAFSALIHSKTMTAGECAALSKYLCSKGEFLSMDTNFRNNHNHGGFQNNGFARVIMFFPEFKTYSQWLELANSRYTMLLKNVISEDGSYKEASSSYASALITNVYDGLGFMKNFGYTLGEEGRDLLAKGSRYLCDIAYPNMISFPYGQSSSASITKEIRTYAGYLGDDELLYIISNGKEGTEPQNGPSVSYPGNHKWGIMKSSWDSDARALYINNGGGDGLSHTQLDNLAIVAYGYGAELLPDSGCFSYDGTDSALWLDSTEAHSTIMIDGLEQSKSQVGTIDKWVTNKGFDFYQGTGKLAPTLSNTHSRNVLFVKPGFWIVSDSLKGTGTHTYEQNWHFLYGQTPEINPETKSARSTFETQANIQIVPVDPGNLTATLNDGYQCSVKGAMEHTKFLKYTKQEDGNTYYDTVLFPVEAGSEAHSSVKRIDMDVTPDVATAFEVYITDNSDTQKGVYYLSHENAFSKRTFGDYSFDGKCSYISYDSSGKLESFYVIGGSDLTHNHNVLFETNGNSVSDLSVSYEDSTIVLESEKLTLDDINDISLYANNTGVSEVLFNGTSVDFVQSGNYVYFDITEPEKADGWYFIERFNENEFSVGNGNDIAFDPAADASTTGWWAYWKSSKGTVYGKAVTAYDDETPYDKCISLNRSKSSSTNATVRFGYYDVNGFTDDEFIVDMDVKIAPAEEEASGNYFRKTVELGSAYGGGSPVAYVVFTNDIVDDSEERVSVVKYYDVATDTEIEIPGLRNFKNNNWYSIRFKVNNATNTYDLYFADGKDATYAEPVKTGIAFNDATIKEVYITATRNASDANGLYGGGVICLDNLKIGAETSADNLYRIGKAEERIDFEDVALNASLHDTPDANLAWDVSTRSSRVIYGQAAIEEECANRMMRLYMHNNYAAKIYTSYPIASGIGAPDGITTVQFRYKNNTSDISNQNDIIELFTDSVIANGLYNYGIHIFFHKGDVYVASQSGTAFIAELPAMTIVDGVDKMDPQKWYTVKVVANFNNMTYDLYISDSEADGGETPIAAGISMYKQDNLSYVPADEIKIRRIHFLMPYDPADSNFDVKSDFYIDDLIFNPDLSAELYDSIIIDSSLISQGTLGINVPLNLITYNSTFEPDDISHKLVVAVYGSDNSLKAVDTAPGAFNGNAISKTITLDPKVYEESTIKVFLLDGLNSLIPLGSFETLP